MSGKIFRQGLELYEAGNYQDSLEHFNDAVDLGGHNLYQILDTRAAVHAKLGKHKEALKDAKRTIDIAPDRWQGYARAARLFLQLGKLDSAQTMITIALDRLKQPERRPSLLSLQAEIHTRKKWFTDHSSQLPIEVFGQIARIVVEADHTALIPLVHVSKRWRTVIWNNPSLWAKLVLTSRRPMSKAKLWLERTKGNVKELVVTSGAAWSSNWPGNSLDGLQWDNLLIFHSERWAYLTYLQSIGKEAAMTKWIGLTVEDTRLFSIPLLQAPFLLNSLSLSRTNVDINKSNLCERFNDLRSCTIRSSCATTGSWANILKANPLLERLELHAITSFDPKPLPSILELDHLTTLEAISTVPIDIFKAKMPNLRKLRLGLPLYSPDVFIRHLNDTLIGGLTELRLHGCRLNDSTNLLSLLRLSSRLRVLEVTSLTIGIASLLNSLSAHHITHPSILYDDDPPPILCPKLTHVNFSGCPEVQAGLLMRLIKSRWIGDQSAMDQQTTSQIQTTDVVSKIESLVIDFCPNVEKEWVKRMEDLVSHVSCRYTTKNMRKGRILV